MEKPKNIIIRLPNWLGDMVMSTAFVKAVQHVYPDSSIDLICKKGIDFLLANFPHHNQSFIFDKTAYKGLKGAWKFGRNIAATKKYDLFFCLPDSFSSAVMAKASGAAETIGFKKEGRSVLLSHTYNRPRKLHRVEEYINLLEQFIKKSYPSPQVGLTHAGSERKKILVININSEASSRRLPVTKAISLINTVRKTIKEEIILIGSAGEQQYVDTVYNLLENRERIRNIAGTTTLPQLLDILSCCTLMLTTDSGPAHLGNALRTHTVVLFGAGNEHNTAPYDQTKRTIVRLNKLKCERCVKNECKEYSLPECLLQLDEYYIAGTIATLLNNSH